ncbi:hypothetical protein RB201_04135 [Streptomyces sp. S1A(2023)]
MARYEINYLDESVDKVTNAAGHDWTTDLLVITDGNNKTLLLAPTGNIRSVLIHNEAVLGEQNPTAEPPPYRGILVSARRLEAEDGEATD